MLLVLDHRIEVGSSPSVASAAVDWITVKPSATTISPYIGIALTKILGNMTLTANTVTLKAGRTYKLSGNFMMQNGGAANALAEYFWYAGSVAPSTANLLPNTSIGQATGPGSTINSAVPPVGIYTATVDTVVGIQFGATTNMTNIDNTSYGIATVQQIGSVVY